MLEKLLVRMSILIAFSLGTLLIVIYPAIKKYNNIFAIISILVGSLVICFILLWLVNLPKGSEIFWSL